MKKIIAFCCAILWCYYANSQTVLADVVTLNPNDKFTYDNKDMPHYGLKWPVDSWQPGGNSAWLSGYSGIKMFTNGQPRVAIDISGRVGIGTTNPGFKLSVVGDGYFNGHIYSEINNNEGGALSLMNTLKTGANVSRWTIYNMTSQYGNALKFWKYSADLTNTGAQFILKDNGTSAFMGDLGIGTEFIDNTQGWSRVLDVAGDGHAKLLVRTSVIKTGIFSHDTWNGIAAGRIGTESAHPLILTAGFGNDVMCLTTDSKVGIGTTTPSEKLSVNGNIRTRKVIVTQTGWPDYVFDSSYQLPSLDSVSSFIQVNKHLPDMPSAAVVERDGHDLGEVQKLLLKKMEEMTLYMIELKKENETLRVKVETLTRKVENKE
ncbi:MAG: hypothetical protein J0I41_24315 [Filimonas sp.]|nr:hypothetical protein [Filimonas sp.]